MAEESLDPKTNLPKLDPLEQATTIVVDPLEQATTKSNSHILGFDRMGTVISNPTNTNTRLRRDINQVDPIVWGEYSKIESRPFAEDAAMNTKIAQKKSTLDQFGNSLAQFGYNVVGGAAMALSSWDMSDAVDIASGVEKEYGNSLYRWAEDMLSESREKHPVYSLNPGTFDPSDPNWWFQQTADMGTSVGFAGEMFLETLVLGALTAPEGGSGGLATLASIPSRIKALKNIKNLAKTGNLSKLLKLPKNLKNIRNQATFGLAKGYQEGLVEAYESYSSIEDQYLQKGYSKEEAQKFASLGAATTFKSGVLPNMLLNSFQFATMSYNPVSKTTTNIFDRVVKNKVLKGALNVGSQIVSEGTEEAIQTMAQMEGQYQAELESGELEPMTGRFSEYISDGETWNAFVAGAFGGTVFTGLGSLRNKFQNKQEQEHWANKHSTFVNEMNTEKLGFLKDIKEAEARGDIESSMELRRDMGAYNAVKGLYLDALTDKSSGFKSYTSYLENTLNYVNSNDTERLQELGIKEEDHQFIKENFPKYLKDSSIIKSSFDKAVQYNEREAVIPIVENEYKQYVLEEESIEINQELEKTKRGSANYNKLSSNGRQKLDLEIEKLALKKQKSNLKTLSETKNKKELDKEIKKMKVIEEGITSIDTQIEEIHYEEKDYSQKQLDNSIISSMDKESLSDLQYKSENNENLQAKVRDNLTWWRKKENQKVAKSQKTKERVSKAKTSTEVKQAKEELIKEDVLTEKQTEVINDKIETMEVKEASKTNIPNTSFGTPVSQEEEAPSTNPTRTKESNNIIDIVDEETKDSSGNYTVAEDDDLFEPADITNISEDNLNRLSSSVETYYNSLKTDLGKTPTFSDFIRDFIDHNGRESTDRIYNALVEAWKRNNYKLEDFDALYKDFFLDRKVLGQDILSISEEMISPITNTDTIKRENENTIEEVIEEESPIIELDVNNQPLLRDQTPFRTSSPELKAAHLSIPYKRDILEDEETGEKIVIDTDTSDELNAPQYVNSSKLLNPDLFNPGTKLKVRIPEDYRSMKVAIWEDEITKGQSLTFEEWARNNNIEEGSPEWINKIPMIAYDQEGEGVFFIHDTDWYNAVNVGLKDDPKKQREVINEAKKRLSEIRSKVSSKLEMEIEITVKRPGTWKQINKDQDAITLNEANPHTQLAIANDQGELLLNGESLFENNDRVLLNRKQFKRGHTYDIRKVSSNEYIAFDTLRDTLSEESLNTVKIAVRTYLKQYSQNTTDKSKVDSVRDQVLSSTNLDLFDKQDFEDFISQYIPTVRGKFSGVQDIHSAIESNTKILSGTPYISIQKGSLVFGVKGKNISGQQKILYIHPKKMGDQNGEQMINSILSSFDNMLPTVTQNVSKQGLQRDRKMVNIDNSGNVTPIGSYQNYIKDNLKTSIKSYNVGTTEKPVYATIIQPVINFKDAKTDWDTFVDTGKVSDKAVENIADKIKRGTPLSTKEESMRQESSQEIEDKLKKETPIEIENVDNEEIYKDTLQSLRELGVSEADPAIVELKKLLGIEDLYEPSDFNEATIQQIKEELTGIEGLSIIQNFQIVDFVFNQIAIKMSFKHKDTISMSEISSMLRDSYKEYISPKQDEKSRILANLKSIHKEGDKPLGIIIDRFEKEMKIFQVLENNWGEIVEHGVEKIEKYTGIKGITAKEDQVDISQDTPQVEKNYSKTSLEENGKDTSSYRLRRFFSGVKQVNPDGTLRQGFLGIPTYVGFDTVYSTIEQVISSPYEVDSNFDLMIARLEDNVGNQKWLRQVIDQLKEADEQIKNEFVYNFTRHTLSMKFVMFSKNRDGAYTLKAYDTNSNEITRVIRTQWDSNLKQTPLTYVEDGKYKINKERVKYLLNTYNSWKTKADIINSDRKSTAKLDIPNSELQSWLSDFGIELSDETLKELKNKEIEFTTSHGKEKKTFNKMFENSPNTTGIFGLLANYLESISKKSDTEFVENESNHPFNNASNVLKKLARIESKYALYATTNSFRDGGKSIYGFTPTKHTSDTVKKLKFDPEFRKSLSSKSFNRHSYILNLLNTSEEFQEKFYLDHIGITAIKELGKKTFGDNSVTSLSDSDHELTKLGFFQDIEQGEVKGNIKGIDFRMARMFLPTMSDKSQMLDLYTAVLDLKTKHFNWTGGNAVMGGPLKEVLYSQLILPELERITNFHSSVGKTNIKAYDLAAQMFLLVPELNNLVDPTTGKRVISLMANNPAQFNLQWFEENIKEKALGTLQEFINAEVSNKRDEWLDNGFIDSDNNISYMNKKYFDRLQGDQKTKVYTALNDFVINSILTNANTYMTIAGDLAVYSQDKISKYFQNGKPYLPKEEYGEGVYSKIVKDIIGVNAGKRLALLLAPGNKLANSLDSEYNQIYLNDLVDISSNIPTLVDIFYGSTEAKKATRLVNEYKQETDLDKRKDILKDLTTTYSKIGEYFDIEATDAQEYTTIKEHIDVLWGQGRLSSDQYKDINDKLSKDQNLTYSNMKLVFQPIKPVYTGMKDEQGYDVMRVMYIKSSSFPLLPQLTKGTELDKLRLLMEDYQSKTGKNVRASYQSANKVGAISDPITPFNTDGTFNSNITIEDVEKSSLILDRDNFRIQQDVPFKSNKKNEDTVSLGTQTLKLLFGDGVMNIDGFQFEGESYTGEELKDKFNSTYNDYISHRKNMLYKQLGVDSNGKPEDVEHTMNQLQDLLKKEAEDRGYPRQDVEALKLVPKYNSKGELVNIQFTTPLWLSPNSNRYESLLNAIVTNRLVNVKLPGASYVVGSEAGFKFTDSMEGIQQSNIVYTSNWDGSLKAAEFNEDGSLKKTQVLAPSKIRDNRGNLISLINKDGTINNKYVTKSEDGTLRLKEDVISPELLGLTSFRIPTSGHVSMSQIEIVGILPTEVGDLMIVPKNLTKQKGLDFDVDKETTYQLWSYTDSEGNIKPLDKEGKEYLMGEASKIGKLEEGVTKKVDTLIEALFGEDFDLSGLKEDNFLDKLEDKLQQKLYENSIVKVHSSVLSNPSKGVQSKINKTLSMDFAKAQSEIINKAVTTGESDKYFSVLSDQYQKDKMFLGASGKLGIGVYSNYVVFNSMIQQSSKPVQLKEIDEESGEIVNLKVQIGKFISEGTLGAENSLATGDLKRSLAEVFAERQNTATDNEKEQIMGKVNVNEVTINVDSLLSALGFDKDILKDGTQVSIPYLLLSQPIIREYVNAIRKTKSNTTDYNPAAKQEVIDNLKEKYNPGKNYDANLVDKMLTGQILFDNLDTTKVNSAIQIAVLDKFIMLDTYATKLARVQSRLNINNTGLGKSFFDTLDKYEAIQQLDSDPLIKNIDLLVGDYIDNDGTIDTKQLEKEGYLNVGNKYIKPTTPVGAMLVNAVKSGYDLWGDFFPYNDINVKAATNQILDMVSGEDASSQKIIELKQNIFKEMKKYFVSSQKLGIIQGDPQAERRRLFIDTENNSSLASYLNKIIRDSDKYPTLASNKLVGRFEYNISTNGSPSIIRFDNTKGENFDEDYLYTSLIELMEYNTPLPDFNGKPYSTRELARDLISYSYLEGGIQEAIQFTKHIPISYLNAIPFSGITREWNSKYRPDIFGRILGVSAIDEISIFSRQYAQNNPEKFPKITLDNVYSAKYTKDKNVEGLESFSIDANTLEAASLAQINSSNFVVIYNSYAKKGLKKFQVYEKNGNEFNRISTLGTFGMAEYSASQKDVRSVINDYYKLEDTIQSVKIGKEPGRDVFQVKEENLSQVVSNISDHTFENNKHLKPLADAIQPFITNDIKLEVQDITNDRGQRIARGKFNTENKVVTIDRMYLNKASEEDIAKTIIHELIHGLTSSYISKYIDNDGKYKVDNPPADIVNLVVLFNETKRKLGPESEAYKKKLEAQKRGDITESTTERERTIAYAGTNIKEFVTLVMTEPNFQKEMMDVKYKVTDKTLMERFSELVNNILKSVLGDSYNTNGVTYQGVKTTLSLIESQSIEATFQSKYDEMRDNDSKSEDILNTGFGDAIIPGKEDFKEVGQIQIGQEETLINSAIEKAAKEYFTKYPTYYYSLESNLSDTEINLIYSKVNDEGRSSASLKPYTLKYVKKITSLKELLEARPNEDTIEQNELDGGFDNTALTVNDFLERIEEVATIITMKTDFLEGSTFKELLNKYRSERFTKEQKAKAEKIFEKYNLTQIINYDPDQLSLLNNEDPFDCT